jgi:acyl-CoA synthetase (AMP-forming)/AMP-acid ligase II
LTGNRLLQDVVTSEERRKDYVSRGLWDSSTLAGRVALHAGLRPDDLAVVDDTGEHSYSQLAAHAAALADEFRARGIGSSHVVSIQLPNWYEAVVSAVAVQSMGAVINPLLPNYRARELVNVFATARPAAILTPGVYRDFEYSRLIDSVANETGVHPLHIPVRAEPLAGQTGFEGLVGSRAGRLDAGAADLISELIFTSGTEARPKAIMHTEQTANFSVRVAHSDLGLHESDVVWMPSPVGHSTGFNYGVRFALYHGLPLILQDRWDPQRAVDLVLGRGCSYTLAATTFLADLVSAARRNDSRLTSLRFFGCGGAPVPESLVESADETGIRVLRLYGSTEVLVATWNRPTSTPGQRRRTDGVAMSDVDVEIRDEFGNPVVGDAPGEIHVRGPNTCVGFFDDEARTAATFDPEGWVRSGDLATLDSEGYLTIVGRKKEIIIRGGLNIAPREIEELILTFAEVERVAVVGLPDPRLGERMCACVVLVPGASSLELHDVVARLKAMGVANFKLPERLEILAELPTTASGKIQKHEIVRELTEKAAAHGQ